jgi:Ala-tRNA(Pro) deacylase
MRIPLFLAEQQVAFELLVHPPAFTAQRRAKYLGVPGRHLAKPVLFAGPSGYLLVIVPATHRVDTASVSEALNGPVRLAGSQEIAEVFPDCEWGVVAPFGRLYSLATLLDESLAPDDWILFEAHTHAASIRMRCRDFERLEQPRRLRLARL